MTRNHPLVHRVLAQLKSFEIDERHHLLVAVSGGADSVALFHVLSVLKGVLGFQMTMVHVHHGLEALPEQVAFRNAAQVFCENLAQSAQVRFLTNAPSNSEENPSETEDALRNFRHGFFQKWKLQVSEGESSKKKILIALGHNRSDALETRLIQLIRGSGESGIAGILFQQQDRLRPLLLEGRDDIEEFLQHSQLEYLEDPSNASLEPLRNWLRHQWLPELNKHRPGSTDSLARSLEILANAVSDTQSQLSEGDLFQDQALCRESFQQLSRNEKRRAIALFLSRQGVRGFTAGHVEEFIKRLDTSRKELRFEMLSRAWNITPHRIQASRV